MGRRRRSPVEYEPYYCPKCGKLIPRSESGLYVVFRVGEEEGICGKCASEIPAVSKQIDKVIEFLLKNLVGKLREKGIDYWGFDEKTRYMAYLVYVGHSWEEAEELWRQGFTGAEDRAPQDQ